MGMREYFVAAVILSGASALAGMPAAGQTPPQNETIAYVRTRQLYPTGDIYSMNSDGTNVKALTRDGDSSSPSWSPEGQRILFAQNGNPYRRSRLPGLYAMNRDGSNVHMLWTLEQSEIPYFFGFDVMNDPDSAGAYKFLSVLQNVFSLDRAEWSPDGKTLVAAHTNIVLISANGREEARLLARQASMPSWSPDGKRIAFSQHGAIKVIDSDGSGVVSLTDPISAVSPAWSPDGKQLAFAAALPSHRYEIYLMNSDGSHSRQLTTDPDWGCQYPSWSPDGKRITFSCLSHCPFIASLASMRAIPKAIQDCSERIFVINIDAPPSRLTPLIDEDAEAPVFAPSN